jgi:hypothetical protein
MHFTAATLSAVLLASTVLAGPLVTRNNAHSNTSSPMSGDDMDDSFNIFKLANNRW